MSKTATAAVPRPTAILRLASDAPQIGEIQRGIPIPPRPGRPASELRTALDQMEVGDMRTISGISSGTIFSACKSIRFARKGEGREYTVRKSKLNVIRVWRSK